MSKKSFVPAKEGKNGLYNEELFPIIESIWLNYVDGFSKAKNKLGYLYFMSGFVKTIAYNMMQMESVRNLAAEAREKQDKYLLSRLRFMVDNLDDVKTVCMLWNTVSKDYDNICNIVVGNNDRLIGSIKSSEEILAETQAKKLMEDKRAYNAEVDALSRLIDL